jgi:Tol biopolymer transport system component
VHNCPQPGKWAISVWSGEDDTDTAEALATCGEGGVSAAYHIDSDGQNWLRYFAERADINTLPPLDDRQRVIVHGPVDDPQSTASIAFVSDRDGNDELYVMNADGTGQTNLTNNPADDDRPAWRQ